MSYQYWPVEVGGKEMFGLYEVTLKSEQSSDDYIIRQLTISKTVTFILIMRHTVLTTPQFACDALQDNSESTTVTQYHYLKWPEGGKPKVTSSILKMAADLVKTQSSTGNKGITVVCKWADNTTVYVPVIHAQKNRQYQILNDGVTRVFSVFKDM